MEEYSDYGDYNYTYYENITAVEEEIFKSNKSCFKELSCGTLLVLNVVIIMLGICGNVAVIWIAGFKMKKTVNTTWYLSLAISDLIFCVFLPFNITQMAADNWIFGVFMCKFTSFVMFLNMFSSIFLLVIISVDRCVSVMFPVWAQNHRTKRKAYVMVLLAWVVSIALSIPSVVFRDTYSYLGKTRCFNKYTSDQHSHKSIAVSRFISGFVLPFLIIICCYSAIILRLRNSRMTRSSKPFKVMTALIATFFICWLPYHIFILLELNHHLYNAAAITIGMEVGTSIAAANSFLNPMLYVFMGNDFKKRFKNSLFSKMENAMREEGRTSSHYLSRSTSMDGRASISTHA